MQENEKKHYLEKYKKAKENGVPFFPNILFKDAVIALVVFLALVGLAYFLGAPLEDRANPADTSYTPRPEWYFLFLFQLLKYFPGNLEVIGVIVIPGLVIGLLLLLPLLDRSPRRHLLNRPWVTGITGLIVLGVVGLTVASYLEAPPPAEEAAGDPVAALYTENCAACHGPSITVPEGIDLHNIIAQGTHEGMPAWSGDLDTNEIDALAGFITSPRGNDLYNSYCQECHQISDLVASNQIELRDSLNLGQDYPPHSGAEIPVWGEVLSKAEITDLLNFLVAPDGQRLFTINCATCHGKTVAYAGPESGLREIISQGGLHLEMPSWQSQLSQEQLDLLANFVINPAEEGPARELYETDCSSCHGSRIPTSASLEQAREAIASGGAHQTMPVWGELLTESQLDALTAYTWEAAQGTPLEVGQTLFGENCAGCHGSFGEGGKNPSRSDDLIAPISSAEYLTTRDNLTLYNIIAQGQPNFGMSPYGAEYGGPLTEEQINSIIAYMRTWEKNPPVDLPPEVQEPEPVPDINLTGQEIYAAVCAQCHLASDESAAPQLGDPEFQARAEDQDIYNSIKNGHPSTAMIAFSSLLTDEQIQELVGVIRLLNDLSAEPEEGPGALPSFAKDLVPILEAQCNVCHGSFGGWDGSSYESVINSGDNGPAVIPGDAANSLLAQKLLNTQTTGGLMPPSGKLADSIIQLFLDWIQGGAPNN